MTDVDLDRAVDVLAHAADDPELEPGKRASLQKVIRFLVKTTASEVTS